MYVYLVFCVKLHFKCVFSLYMPVLFDSLFRFTRIHGSQFSLLQYFNLNMVNFFCFLLGFFGKWYGLGMESIYVSDETFNYIF